MTGLQRVYLDGAVAVAVMLRTSLVGMGCRFALHDLHVCTGVYLYCLDRNRHGPTDQPLNFRAQTDPVSKL